MSHKIGRIRRKGCIVLSILPNKIIIKEGHLVVFLAQWFMDMMVDGLNSQCQWLMGTVVDESDD